MVAAPGSGAVEVTVINYRSSIFNGAITNETTLLCNARDLHIRRGGKCLQRGYIHGQTMNSLKNQDYINNVFKTGKRKNILCKDCPPPRTHDTAKTGDGGAQRKRRRSADTSSSAKRNFASNPPRYWRTQEVSAEDGLPSPEQIQSVQSLHKPGRRESVYVGCYPTVDESCRCSGTLHTGTAARNAFRRRRQQSVAAEMFISKSRRLPQLPAHQ